VFILSENFSPYFGLYHHLSPASIRAIYSISPFYMKEVSSEISVSMDKVSNHITLILIDTTAIPRNPAFCFLSRRFIFSHDNMWIFSGCMSMSIYSHTVVVVLCFRRLSLNRLVIGIRCWSGVVNNTPPRTNLRTGHWSDAMMFGSIRVVWV
jgi:hypothetical protein